ncbi:MAG: hypothetical protein PHQ22_08860 [Sulfuricurvum sp.]|nr:hypothetical protein [Sulfuricurvum sp.]MDD5387289.1 hypothetical protein [Sulfuricurvum sp.]
MTTPEFFNDVAPIIVRDPLSEVLGAASNGLIDYTYRDVVKLAGHSCPTVAGAFLMVQEGLKSLYGNETPVRGEIKVLMKGKLGDGVVGVIANVASMITGATDVGGFHGLAGKFDRRQLLFYDADIEGEMAFERVDTGARVALSYNSSFVSGDGRMGELLPLIVSGRADGAARELFGMLWQDRVKRILIENRNDPRLLKCIAQ